MPKVCHTHYWTLGLPAIVTVEICVAGNGAGHVLPHGVIPGRCAISELAGLEGVWVQGSVRCAEQST